MGDMREEFAALQARKEERKAVRQAMNTTLMTTLGVPAVEQSKNVWRVDTAAGAVMYYPATNCWQHKGKTYRGDAEAFAAWYKGRTFARPQ